MDSERAKRINSYHNEFRELEVSPSVQVLNYVVPLLSEDGSCSISDTFQDFCISELLFDCAPDVALSKYFLSITRISKLYKMISNFSQRWSLEWMGAYYRVTRTDGNKMDDFLLKIAYIGSASRAVFPLTTEFSKISNNSYCAMNSTKVIIQDASTHSGPYYICDDRVKSEYCSPLFYDEINSNNNGDNTMKKVVGLLDIESWKVNAFDCELLLEIEYFEAFLSQIISQGFESDEQK